jgi:ABC-type Na+ efflux pump permease subunit
MLLGPFLRREWVTSIRSLRWFGDRRNSSAMLSVFVAGTFLVWDWRGLDRASVSGAARFGDWLFGMIMVAEVALAFQVLNTLAPSIAAERDRKSLDALLTTRLSSAEIVLGNLAAGIIRYLNSVAATMPIVVLVVTLGGIDPELVLLAFACLASMTFSLAAFSVAISAGARTAARSGNLSAGFFALWLTLPWLVVVLKPILWPGGPAWLVDVFLRLLDGSPMGLWMNIMGVIPRPGGLLGAVSWLVGWQVVAGLALIAWAIARLRPASRAVHDVEGRTSRLRSIRAALRRPYPRPVCGDDPVLWNDLYLHQGRSRLARLAGLVLGLVWILALVVGTSWFAGPAFSELRERGYSASPEASRAPEFNPFIRVLVSKMIIKSPLAPQVGQARLEFNIALRQFSAMLSVLFAMSILAAVARSVTTEKRRETWLGLIATPLTGREILGAKMLAGVLHARETALTLIGLWTVGLLAGAVHPIGFLAALTSLIVYGGFASALGSSNLSRYHSPEVGYPGSWPLRLLSLIGVFIFVPLATPFLAYSSLFTYEDVLAVIHGGPIPQLSSSSLKKVAGAREILTAWILTTTALATLAITTTRESFRVFDAAIGRPTRTESPETSGNPAVSVLPATSEA